MDFVTVTPHGFEPGCIIRIGRYRYKVTAIKDRYAFETCRPLWLRLGDWAWSIYEPLLIRYEVWRRQMPVIRFYRGANDPSPTIAMTDAEFKARADRLRTKAVKQGTLSPLWDVIFDADALLEGRESICSRAEIERMLLEEEP